MRDIESSEFIDIICENTWMIRISVQYIYNKDGITLSLVKDYILIWQGVISMYYEFVYYCRLTIDNQITG